MEKKVRKRKQKAHSKIVWGKHALVKNVDPFILKKRSSTLGNSINYSQRDNENISRGRFISPYEKRNEKC